MTDKNVNDNDQKRGISTENKTVKDGNIDNNIRISTEAVNKNPKNANEAFDLILKSVGGHGKWQWRVGLMCGFCGLFTSLHNLGAIFLAASPDHWCDIPSLNVNKTTSKLLRNFTVPWEKNKDGDLAPSKCSFYKLNYTGISNADQVETFINAQKHSLEEMFCQKWHYDIDDDESTIVTEWDLVCQKRYLMPVTQASFMFGILVGAVLFSIISDKIGRRRCTMLCTIIFFVSATTAGFSNSLDMFLILRFLTAAAGQGMYLVLFVLSVEVVEQKWRTIITTLGNIFFPIGFMLLTPLAYFTKEWRILQFVIGAPTVILLGYYWLLPESPRWLIMQGRHKEGVLIMEDIAKTNNKSLPAKEELDKYIAIISKESFKMELKGKWKQIHELASNLWALVRTPNMRRRSCIIFFAWFVISAAYYGLAFTGPILNFSLYIMTIILSFLELVLLFPSMYFLHKFGRRLLLSIGLIICGLSLVTIVVIPKEYFWVNTVFTIIGRCTTVSGFFAILFYSPELVPTNIRNISMGISSMWGRIGSIIAPFVVDLLGEIYYAIPSIFFGIISLISGCLCLLLPETGFSNLPESINEIESQPK